MRTHVESTRIARPRQGAAATPSRFTSPDRIVYPDAGITKLQVADYYRAVAAQLLPDLVRRPLSVVRCPDGIGECFFQKHHASKLGANVRAVFFAGALDSLAFFAGVRLLRSMLC